MLDRTFFSNFLQLNSSFESNIKEIEGIRTIMSQKSLMKKTINMKEKMHTTYQKQRKSTFKNNSGNSVQYVRTWPWKPLRDETDFVTLFNI